MFRQFGLRVIPSPGTGEQTGTPVRVAEDIPQSGVVAPCLQFAGGCVPGGGQFAGVLAGVRFARLEPDAREPLVKQPGDVPVEQHGADTGAFRAAACLAAVGHEAFLVDHPAEYVPAAGASCDPGEQPVSMAGAFRHDATDRVGAFPQAAVDDGGPRVLYSESARSDEHADVGFGADDSLHGRCGPAFPAERGWYAKARQAVRDESPAVTGSPCGDDARDDRRGVRVDERPSVRVPLVAVRCAAGESSGGRGALLSDAEVLVGLVALPLRHQQQQAEHGASHGGCRVDGFGDGHDAGALGVQPFDDRQAAYKSAGEPVKPRDDKPTGFPVFDALERGVHSGAVHGAAGLVEVFVPCAEADAVSLRPCGDGVALLVGGLEAFAGASSDHGNAYVSVHGERHSRIPITDATCQLRVETGDKAPTPRPQAQARAVRRTTLPKFRQKPSSRRQARPTASWLVLGMSEARLVVHGQRTTHLTLVKPSHHRRRYHKQQRLAVKAYVGGVTECHVVVSDAQRIQLGQVDYGLVRELGYHRVDAFRIAWVEDHDQAWLEGVDPFIDTVADGMLDRFDRRHAHREVWVVRFALDRMLPVRFLAQNSEEGYTESAARALKDEPPALYDHEWKDHVGANLERTHEQWLALTRDRARKPERLPKHLRKAA